MQRKKLYAILLSASMIAGQGAMPVMAEEILVFDEQQTEDTSVPAEEKVVSEDIIITEEEVPADAQGDVVEEDIIIPETEEVPEEIITQVQEESIETPADAIAVEEEAVPAEATTVVTKESQTITGVSDSYRKTYGNAEFSLNASAQTALSYESSNTSVATVNPDGVVSIVGAGTATITITAEETSEYLSATKVVTVTVDRAMQKINLPATSYTKATTDSSFNLGATVNSGNTLTYESTDKSVVTVDSEGNVTIKGAGTATIKVIAEVTPNYWKATWDVNVTVKTDITSKFTDTNFAKKVRDALEIAADAPIYAEDCAKQEWLNVSEVNIKNMNGLEYFTGLVELICNNSNLTSLDVSKNTALTGLSCSGNNLTSLDLSKNINLGGLNCAGNQLTSLNLSGLTKLESLICFNNQLTSLDLTKNTSLVYLWCYDNQLTSLDLTKCTNLLSAYTDCHNNWLTLASTKLPSPMTVDDITFAHQYQKIAGPAASYTKTWGDASFNLGATAQTELSYVSDNPSAVAVDSKGTVSIKASGTATITITAPEDNYYYAAEPVSVKVTVNPASQTITTLMNRFIYTLGKPDFNVGAKANTALTYSSDNPSVASVSPDGTVSMKDAGAAIITITAVATPYYKEAVKKIQVIVKPQATSITKMEPAVNGVTLTWNKVEAADGYALFRSTDGVNFSFAKKFTSNSILSFTDTGSAVNGSRYYYKVMTYVAEANGPYSGIKSYYRLARPTISSAVNSAAGKATISYSKNTQATGYQIQLCTSSSFTGASTTIVLSNATTSKTLPGLTKGKTYYIRVRSYKKAENGTNYSAWSTTKALKITK